MAASTEVPPGLPSESAVNEPPVPTSDGEDEGGEQPGVVPATSTEIDNGTPQPASELAGVMLEM